MTQSFLTILNISITASWLVLAVIVLRCLLRKSPKSLTVVMWALVGIRLMFPFSVESAWSLIPSAQTVPENILSSENPEIQSGILVIDSFVNSGVSKLLGWQNSNGKLDGVQEGKQNPSQLQGEDGNQESVPDANQNFSQEQNAGINLEMNGAADFDSNNKDSLGVTVSQEGTNAIQIILKNAAIVWVVGMSLMLAYSFLSWLRLRQRVQISLLYNKNIYFCDEIDNAFILGVFRPRIYLPAGMDEEQISYVIEHEQAHLARKDHWWKALGFLLLAVYWFNPMMWVAYILLCRDIEMACDEKVIRDMDVQDKKSYSEALVACSVQRKMILVCPLAFGEVGVKERIKAMKNYRKPAFWIVLVAIVACVGLVVGFLTNPVTDTEDKNEDTGKRYYNEMDRIKWGEGEYPSLVMYCDTLYAASEAPEDTEEVDEDGYVNYQKKGEIQSSIESGIPSENFQSNDPLEGCEVYVRMYPTYLYVLQGEEKLWYKDVTEDEELFSDICGSFSRTRTGTVNFRGETKAFVQNLYLSAAADTEQDYLQYFGGIEWSEKEGEGGKYIIWLTQMDDDILAFYDEMIRREQDFVYKKCEASKRELNALLDYITEFIVSYHESKEGKLDEEFDDLMHSISTWGSYVGEQNRVRISIVDCNDKKIALFKEKISDSEYIVFEDSDGFFCHVMHQIFLSGDGVGDILVYRDLKKTDEAGNEVQGDLSESIPLTLTGTKKNEVIYVFDMQELTHHSRGKVQVYYDMVIEING